MTAARKLPQYQCHKQVGAIKIGKITRHDDSENVELTCAAEPQMVVTVTDHFVGRHNPQIGGYFVQYEGGYTSYSPAKEFEDGYQPLDADGFPTAPAKSRYHYPASAGPKP